MEELYNLGISENTIKSMLDLYPNLNELTIDEIIEKEKLLEAIDCSKSQILNIISSNVMFLDKTNEEALKLFEFLKELGFSSLNVLFDSNPYILNLEPFEIRDYIKKRLNNNESLENIIDDLDSNPFLFNEI